MSHCYLSFALSLSLPKLLAVLSAPGSSAQDFVAVVRAPTTERTRCQKQMAKCLSMEHPETQNSKTFLALGAMSQREPHKRKPQDPSSKLWSLFLASPNDMDIKQEL